MHLVLLWRVSFQAKVHSRYVGDPALFSLCGRTTDHGNVATLARRTAWCEGAAVKLLSTRMYVDEWVQCHSPTTLCGVCCQDTMLILVLYVQHRQVRSTAVSYCCNSCHNMVGFDQFLFLRIGQDDTTTVETEENGIIRTHGAPCLYNSK